MTNAIASDTRLQGRALTVARAVWAGLTLLCLAVFLFALPARYAQFLSPKDEIREGLARLGYAEQYIEQYGSEAAGKEAVAPLGLSPAGYAGLYLGLEVLVAGVYIVVGLVVAWRKFDDGFGLFASLFLIAFGVGGSSYMYLALAVKNPAGFLLSGVVVTLAYALMPPFFYLFPDGRWVPRWGWVPAGLWAFTSYFWNFAPRSPLNPTNWPLWLFLLNLLFIWGSAVIAQIYRYFKVSSATQRQQTKWLVSGFGLSVVLMLIPSTFVWLFVPSFLTETLYSVLIPIQVVLLGIIPITIGFSILRYRLWDIDLLIRKTLVYSALTGALALTYFGSVVVLQGLFTAITGQQSAVVVVLSTLAIAALFFPLRKRVQDFIDKRFYRKKYDAAKVIAEFAGACRDETDLEKLTARLVEVVDETMQPERVSVWLKPTLGGKQPTSER
jgi:hypothetical protein